MDIRALELFLSVADTLNFSRSSEQLHMSLSAVSRGIARLEEELGQCLLERDRRSMRLTPQGVELRNYARRSVDEWHQLRQRIGTDSAVAGELSLFCSVTASYSVLAPILDTLRQRYPAIDLSLHTGDPADALERVLAGREDLAVTGLPAELPERLAFLPLLSSPLCLIAPKRDCAVRDQLPTGAVTQSVDWQALPFIVPERGPTQVTIDNWFASQGIQPRIYARVAGHEAIVAMVSLGLGVGFAPELVIATSGLADSVDVLSPPAPLEELPIGLCALERRREHGLLRAFWHAAMESYPSALV